MLVEHKRGVSYSELIYKRDWENNRRQRLTSPLTYGLDTVKAIDRNGRTFRIPASRMIAAAALGNEDCGSIPICCRVRDGHVSEAMRVFRMGDIR